MVFTVHLQASMFTGMNSYPSSLHMLPELYPLSLHCPYTWIHGHLVLWINRMEKTCAYVVHTEKAKSAHFYDLVIG